MAEDVRITNLPNAGSKEAVALELWKVLRDYESKPDDQLRFFVRCYDAAKGVAPK